MLRFLCKLGGGKKQAKAFIYKGFRGMNKHSLYSG